MATAPSSAEPARGGYISLGYYPAGLRRTGDLIVVALDGGSVALLDPSSGEVSERYKIDPSPEEAVADSSHIYVLNRGGRRSFVSLISRKNGTTDRTSAEVGRGPTGIAREPSRGVLYVANFASRSVAVLDDHSLELVGELTKPEWKTKWGYPTDVVAIPSHARAYVTSTRGFIIELAGPTVTQARKVMPNYVSPSLEWVPKIRRVVLTSDRESALVLVAPDSLRVKRRIDLDGLQPDRVAIDPKLMIAGALGIVERKDDWDIRLRFVDLRRGRILGETIVGMGGWDVETIPGSWNFYVSDALGDGLEVHRLDGAPPASTIITPAEQLCSPCSFVTGSTVDDLSGIRDVTVTFRIGSQIYLERGAELRCRSPLECRWKVTGPQEPGVYRISVTARDDAGNLEQNGPSMDVIWAP